MYRLYLILLLALFLASEAREQTVQHSVVISVAVLPGAAPPATYTVFRALGPCSATSFSLIAKNVAAPASGPLYKDSAVAAGLEYCYWVMDSNNVPTQMLDVSIPKDGTVVVAVTRPLTATVQ